MKKNQLIIIGGGPSLIEGINLGLWEKLRYQFTIGTNFSYRYFTPTILTFTDKDFYDIGTCTFKGDEVLKHRESLSKLPCIIGNRHRNLPTFNNTILVPSASKYNREITTGVYTSWLTGAFSLTLGIWALDFADRENLEIFLLGMDFGGLKKDKELLDEKGQVLTHFYGRDIVHGGTGKVSHFNMHNKASLVFGPYKEERKVKIYNVCPTSKIPDDIFEKITYEEFFNKLEEPNRWHLDWVKEIKDRLKDIF